MRAAETGRIYTESVSAKVTPKQLAAIEEAAKGEGLKAGEWVRKLIDNALKGEASGRVLLAEIVALRTVLMTLKMARWRTEDFTDEDLRALADAADARRFAQADARILAGKNE